MKPPTFNSYEEISTQYPIDGIHNVCFSVSKHYDNCLREVDLKLAKKNIRLVILINMKVVGIII